MVYVEFKTIMFKEKKFLFAFNICNDCVGGVLTPFIKYFWVQLYWSSNFLYNSVILTTVSVIIFLVLPSLSARVTLFTLIKHFKYIIIIDLESFDCKNYPKKLLKCVIAKTSLNLTQNNSTNVMLYSWM